MIIMTTMMMSATMIIGRGGKKWKRVNERGRRNREGGREEREREMKEEEK